MNQKADKIREIAGQLSQLSTSSNADGSSYITKNDLEKFKSSIVSALLAVAEVLES